jgi:rhodanese-related sulfurtransferase
LRGRRRDDELHDALGKPGTVLVNVHLDSDIKSKTTFIAGEIHVPVDALRQRLDQIPKDANVYLVSDDYHDVVTAANILADAGYPFVYRVTAGFAAYRSKYPAK